jgi:small GTP-binding protein
MLEYKVCMLGETGAGKTSLAVRFCSGCFDPTMGPTVGCACLAATVAVNARAVTLNIWDTAGQERFQSLVPLYVRNAHGIVFVCDLHSPAALPGLEQIFTAVREQLKADMQLICCGNKVDLLPAGVDHSAIAAWAAGHRMPFLRASAQTGEGVVRLFETLAASIDSQGVTQRRSRADTILSTICDDTIAERWPGCC